MDIPELLDEAERGVKGVGVDVLVYVSFVDELKVGEGELEVVSFEWSIMNER